MAIFHWKKKEEQQSTMPSVMESREYTDLMNKYTSLKGEIAEIRSELSSLQDTFKKFRQRIYREEVVEEKGINSNGPKYV